MRQEGVKAACRGGACSSRLRFDTVLAAELVIGLLWVVCRCSNLGQIAKGGGGVNSAACTRELRPICLHRLRERNCKNHCSLLHHYNLRPIFFFFFSPLPLEQQRNVSERKRLPGPALSLLILPFFCRGMLAEPALGCVPVQQLLPRPSSSPLTHSSVPLPPQSLRVEGIRLTQQQCCPLAVGLPSVTHMWLR